MSRTEQIGGTKETEIEPETDSPTLRRRLRSTPMVRQGVMVGAFALALFLLAVEPVAAQNMTKQQACNNPLMNSVQNATLFLTFAGPSVGGLNAGRNMLKAAATNKSSDKKECKEGIKDSLVYGFGLGMLMGIINLVSSFGPMTTC